MWGGFESRKFPRLKADCAIHIKQIDGGKSIKSVTENIGMGGICVILNESLQKFSQVKMDLDLSDGGEKISCEGRVVWIVPSRDFVSEKLTHDTGIEFMSLPENARQRIDRLISAQHESHHN